MQQIATWNVNSIRTRLSHLLAWLEAKKPDIVLLQEIKCQEEQFPYEPLETLGYNCAVYGQKSYNGVAILSKSPLEDVQKGLPRFDDAANARYIEAFTQGVRVASVYVPNGQEIGCEKFAYKLDFLQALETHFSKLLTYEEKSIIGGDYNIAPRDEDVYDVEKFRNRILSSPQERESYWRLENLGFTDAVRILYPAIEGHKEDLYTWWDYRQGSWEQNRGLRIDHMLLTPQAADALITAEVDTTPRGWAKPSDHTPVVIQLTSDT